MTQSYTVTLVLGQALLPMKVEQLFDYITVTWVIPDDGGRMTAREESLPPAATGNQTWGGHAGLRPASGSIGVTREAEALDFLESDPPTFWRRSPDFLESVYIQRPPLKGRRRVSRVAARRRRDRRLVDYLDLGYCRSMALLIDTPAPPTPPTRSAPHPFIGTGLANTKGPFSLSVSPELVQLLEWCGQHVGPRITGSAPMSKANFVRWCMRFALTSEEFLRLLEDVPGKPPRIPYADLT